GQAQPARSALRRAWALSAAAGWDARLPEVALALGEVVDSAGSVDAELVRMLEHALARTAPGDRLGRIRLTARLATELYWTPRLTEGRRRAADAVAAARRLGDRRALAVAVAAQQFALRGPDDLRERTRLGEELVGAARDLGEEVLEVQARRLLLADRLQTDRAAAQADLAGLDALAASTRRPLARWYVLVNRCVLAALAGDPAEALHLVRETEELGRRLGAAPARMYGVGQRYALLRQQGCGARSEDELRAVAADYPRLATLRCDLVLLLAEADRAEEAAPLLEQLVVDDCAAIPRDALWLASLCVLVLAAARLGRTQELAVLERLLAPYAGRIALQGLAVWWGAVDHYLGCAYVGLGRLECAESAHRRALRLHHSWAAEPFVRLSQEAVTDVARRRAADGGAGTGGLTGRERQVLRLLQGGAANKQIARELGISVHTVERHVTNLYAKIGARSRSQATALGLAVHP
ncbi:MAG: helix-turn-helix transcriptional regulator, partial [Actinomycetota bacterium]|nr:helix-turn-helix transcriptional regulator [Actinomycetota bacterium]